MKKVILLLFMFLSSCDSNDYDEGAFSDTERINVYSSSANSLQWESSIRDYEVIVIVTDQSISIVNNTIDTSSFTTANTRYWRLSFGNGSNGSINPSTEMSDSISTLNLAAMTLASPRYWIVYSYDKNGNLIRSSLIYSFT